jgi:hypothetical protein
VYTAGFAHGVHRFSSLETAGSGYEVEQKFDLIPRFGEPFEDKLINLQKFKIYFAKVVNG